MHHQWRRNVTTYMVGLKNDHIWTPDIAGKAEEEGCLPVSHGRHDKSPASLWSVGEICMDKRSAYLKYKNSCLPYCVPPILHVGMYTNTHAHMCALTHAHTCTQTHTRVRSHIHTHTQKLYLDFISHPAGQMLGLPSARKKNQHMITVLMPARPFSFFFFLLFPNLDWNCSLICKTCNPREMFQFLRSKMCVLYSIVCYSVSLHWKFMSISNSEYT